MEKTKFSEWTDEELLEEKKKVKKSKVNHAVLIGFFAGILIFGFVSWTLSPNRRIGFLIPMAIPVIFIYKMLKSPNENEELEKELKERNMN